VRRRRHWSYRVHEPGGSGRRLHESSSNWRCCRGPTTIADGTLDGELCIKSDDVSSDDQAIYFSFSAVQSDQCVLATDLLLSRPFVASRQYLYLIYPCSRIVGASLLHYASRNRRVTIAITAQHRTRITGTCSSTVRIRRSSLVCLD
jgi:hypothetical protein